MGTKSLSLKTAALLAVVCFGTVVADARPGHGGGASSAASACYNHPSYLADDGCLGAPAGRVIDANLFATMRQSGQAQYYSAAGVQSDHPVPQNVAGLDYGVGNVGVKCGGTCKIPGVDTLPTGASLDNTNHVVNVSFTGSDITFSGWDLTGWSMNISGTSPATLHLMNFYWEDSPFTYQQSILTGQGIIRSTASACISYDVQNSEFVRDFATYPATTWSYYIYQVGSGSCKPTTTVLYSYFQSVPQHAIRIQSSGATTAKWNLFRGMGECSDLNGGLTNPASCAHGNFYVQFASQPSVDTQDISFDTMWTDDQSMSATSEIAWFINGVSGFTVHHTMLRAKYNIMVSNINSHYSSVIGSVGYLMRWLPQGTGTGVVDASDIVGNAVDCTGAQQTPMFGGANAGTLTQSGNFSLLSGAGFSVDGTLPTGAGGCHRFTP